MSTEIEVASEPFYESPRDQYVESPVPLKLSEIVELWQGNGIWTKENIERAYRQQDWRYMRMQVQARREVERESIVYEVDGKFQDRVRNRNIASLYNDINEIEAILEAGIESVVTRGGIPAEVPLRPESRSKLLMTKAKLFDQLAERVGIKTFKIEVDMNEQEKWEQKQNALLVQENPKFGELLKAAGMQVPALPPTAEPEMRDITAEMDG